VRVPVVCIGNFTLGGAGKTPTAIAAAQLLAAAGERPVFLTRGYGGRLHGPVRVDTERHRAEDIGDEPLLLARVAPTIVARDRVAGAKAAEDAGATVIVMDDGFQNSALAKDCAIVVIDAARGIGNARVFPAGPLRAPLALQLTRAHAIVVIGDGDAARPVIKAAISANLPVFSGRLSPDGDAVAALRSQRVLAFAGIGDPEKFFHTLGEAGIDAPVRRGFADHHRYTASEAARLLGEADAQKLTPVTTEKDLVRLTGEPLAALRARTHALPVTLVLGDGEALRACLLRRIRLGA
jgi:tetraacyldisaccharide 4'-kinase